MKKGVFGLALAMAIVLLAGTAMAHRYGGGMMRGYASDDGYGFCNRYADADREEVRSITDKYADQFAALDAKAAAKRAEISKARSNEATTVGQLNKLRAEMFAIKKEYRALAEKVDDELTAKFGDSEEDCCGGMMGGGRHHRGMMSDDRFPRGMMGGWGCR